MNSRDADVEPAQSIRVTIFDQPFTLRSPNGAEHVREVARLLDARMREVSAHLTTHDVAKVAILTALNLADELRSVRAFYEQQGSGAAVQPESETARTTQPQEPAGRQSNAGEQSWFDAIFDTPISTKQANERLSTQVSARLQTLNQPENDNRNE